MEIRQLKTFQAIVNDGGFTKAADRLGYAQSTVTGHIQSIKDELGKPLFDRIGKQMVLTEIGKQLLPYANEIIALMDKAVQLPTEEKEMTGTLVIGASESLATYRLPSVIRAYKDRFPRVELILKPLTAEAMYEELKRGQLDLAFLMEKLITNEDLCCVPLVTEKMALVLPNQQASTAGKDLKDFLHADEVILYTDRGCAYRYIFEKMLDDHDYIPKNTLEFWSVEALKQCIMCGLGVSFLPLITVKKEWINHDLTCILTKDEQIKTQMIYHKNKWLSPSVQSFINLVNEQAEDWRKK
jgi:DNA-binding transcriptional LysR family regulator